MRTLRWIKEGAPLPDFWMLVRVVMQEERPEGVGTSSRRWFLCELESVPNISDALLADRPPDGGGAR